MLKFKHFQMKINLPDEDPKTIDVDVNNEKVRYIKVPQSTRCPINKFFSFPYCDKNKRFEENPSMISFLDSIN